MVAHDVGRRAKGEQMSLIIAFFLFSVHDAHWGLYLGTSIWWTLSKIGGCIQARESKCRH